MIAEIGASSGRCRQTSKGKVELHSKFGSKYPILYSNTDITLRDVNRKLQWLVVRKNSRSKPHFH